MNFYETYKSRMAKQSDEERLRNLEARIEKVIKDEFGKDERSSILSQDCIVMRATVQCLSDGVHVSMDRVRHWTQDDEYKLKMLQETTQQIMASTGLQDDPEEQVEKLDAESWSIEEENDQLRSVQHKLMQELRESNAKVKNSKENRLRVWTERASYDR